MPRITGLHAKIEGQEIPASALAAHIFCRTHNSELAPLDQEAIDLHEGLLRWFEHEDDLLEGEGFWTPTRINVDGGLFGQWLCKWHCNMQTLGGRPPSEYYIRAAFGADVGSRLHFYLRVQFGARIKYQRRIWYADYFLRWPESEERSLFHLYFMGLHFLVCPFELNAETQHALAVQTNSDFYQDDWMEKPQQRIYTQGDNQTSILV